MLQFFFHLLRGKLIFLSVKFWFSIFISLLFTIFWLFCVLLLQLHKTEDSDKLFTVLSLHPKAQNFKWWIYNQTGFWHLWRNLNRCWMKHGGSVYFTLRQWTQEMTTKFLLLCWINIYFAHSCKTGYTGNLLGHVVAIDSQLFSTWKSRYGEEVLVLLLIY